MIAIYIRQSIDKQDSISIETQIELCKKEIKTNESFKIYEDKGFSGKNTERPQFKKLMEDIKNGEITQIIVYRLDRISRSITDFSNIMDILEEHKVSFISANEKFDTSTPTGKAMLYIIMIFAQLERETIAERIRDNYYSRGKTGVWLGGPAPFGYTIKKITKNEKKMSILETTKDIEIVKEIYNLYANTDTSLGYIAKILLEKYGGSMWNNIKLSRIIHNPAYVKANADIYDFFKSKKCNITNDITDFKGEKGCALYGKRDRGSNKYRNYEDMFLSISNHDGVIDSDTWLKCQAKLQNNVQIKNTGKGKHTFLTGLLKCGYCGYSMQVKTYKDKKYLNCTGRYVTNSCIDKLETHHLYEIEDYVFEEIKKFVSNFKNLELSDKKTENDNEINNLKIELHKIEDEIKNIINNLSSANDILLKYANEKIQVISEIELAYLVCKAPIIAITGTNGKTTTTSLLGHILKKYKKTYIAGNIGIPFSNYALEVEEDSVVVLELSSFQLETIKTFKPIIASVLNITEDHLNRHKTMVNYIKAKENIFKNQDENDFLILNYDDLECRKMEKKAKSNVLYFSTKEQINNGIYLKDNYIYMNNYPLINTDDIKILGEHNMENVMVAILMCLCYQIPIDVIIDGVKTFTAVEHRIEYVTTKKGVDYYNDSKGTNTDATIKAIKAMKKPIYLIVGGYEKDADFLPMIKEFKDKVVKAVIIGQVRERMAKDCEKLNFNDYIIKESFFEAINYCYENAKTGECILLSPACASFDMFKDYEERGNIFKNYVKDLKE